ncbi:MAG: hypothetical protein IT435_06170 [Phycisphaerales bacterium]|nr:hypothetical protein [Phycisphaerales bacterium]
MDFLVIGILLIGSFLSVWAISLIVRGLAERAEIRSIRRRARAAGGTVDTDVVAAIPVNPLRNKLVFALAPLAFVFGIWVCWVALGLGKSVNQVRWIEKIGPVSALMGLSQLQIAAALVCVGWWFDPPRGRRRCPVCWYDMAGQGAGPSGGQLSGLCPECGNQANGERSYYRIRRKMGLVWLGAVLGLGVYFTVKTPGAIAKGPLAYIPSTLLVAWFEYCPERLVVAGGWGANDATLQSRMVNGELFDWQRAWLMRRAGELIQTSRRPAVIERCAALLQDHLIAWTDEGLDRLCEMVGSPDARERSAAAAVLARMPGFQVWHSWYGDRTLEKRLVAIAQRRADAAAAYLNDPDANVSIAAMSLVARVPERADAYIAQLVRIINTDTHGRRANAAHKLRMLAELAATSSKARDEFIAVLDSRDERLRMVALQNVGESFPVDESLRARIIGMMDDPSDGVAAFAAFAAGRITESDELVRKAIEMAKSRRAYQEYMLGAVPELLWGHDGYGHPLPSWVKQELLKIITDPHAAMPARVGAAGVFQTCPMGAADVLPGIRALHAELPGTDQNQSRVQWVVAQIEQAAEGEAELAPPEEVK